MATPKELGKIFSEAREKLGLSIEEVCKKSRIHPNIVKDIESGVFDRIGKTYLKSFLKKYSSFLKVDTDNIMREYESISSKVPLREFDLNQEQRGQKDEILLAFGGERLQMIFVGVLSVVLLVLVIVLIGVVKSKWSSVRKEREVVFVQEKKPIAALPLKKTPLPETAPKTDSFTLTLKARGRAWVQINQGETRLFSGILESGDSRTWKSEGTLTVWSGKADMLDFILNGRNIGEVAAGVVKNINVSSQGIKIGDSWVSRID